MKTFFLLAGWLIAVSTGMAQMKTDDWVDVTREEVDSALLSPMGKRLLDDPRFKWLHAHTTHFVIHYERKIFAAKVARQAEFFYNFIAQDLKSAQDRMQHRSHIFIFRDEKDWKYFISDYEVSIEWAFSMVNGMVMYLQQADSSGDSSAVLGHEMTHLVFNRFYPGRIPVWLNEGTAEWYGEFAYAAFKGIKKSKRQVFRRINTVYPVESLMAMSTYPADPLAVRAFYETSKFLVGYMQLNYPPEKFEPFLADMASGAEAEASLQKHYGVPSLAEFSKAFQKFVR